MAPFAHNNAMPGENRGAYKFITHSCVLNVFENTYQHGLTWTKYRNNTCRYLYKVVNMQYLYTVCTRLHKPICSYNLWIYVFPSVGLPCMSSRNEIPSHPRLNQNRTPPLLSFACFFRGESMSRSSIPPRNYPGIYFERISSLEEPSWWKKSG